MINDGQFSYTYDSANRLTQIGDGTFTNEYVYNGDGVRVAQIQDGLRTDYVQDVAAPLPQVLTARQGGTVSKYLRGLGLTGEQTGGTGPNAAPAVWQYHLPDALGSVRQIADPAGQVLQTRRYDPFGGLQSAVGSTGSAYGFAGEEQDSETGQVFLRARTYNPATGRFLQQDPVLGTPSQPNTLPNYVYAFNNPVNVFDPSGKQPPFGFGGSYARRQYGPERTTNVRRARAFNATGSTGGGAMPMTSYSSAPPTQRQARLVNRQSGSSDRSANGAWRGKAYRKQSDPYAREKSEGQRPQSCGLGDIVMGLGKSAVNGNLLNDVAGLLANSPPVLREKLDEMLTAIDEAITEVAVEALTAGNDFWLTPEQQAEQERLARQMVEQSKRAAKEWITEKLLIADYILTQTDWKMVGLTMLSMSIGMLPVVGGWYDAYSLELGYDPITGVAFTTTDKVLITAGIVASIIGLGFVDEVGDMSRAISKGLGNADEVVAAAKAASLADEATGVVKGATSMADEVVDAARGLGRTDEFIDAATATRLKNLDEMTGGNQALKQGDELRDALRARSSRGALSKRMEQARRTRQRLENLDNFTAGNQALKQGDELRQAFREKPKRLGPNRESGSLSQRIDATAAWRKAGANLDDPSVRYMINKGLGPIRGGSGALDDAVRSGPEAYPHLLKELQRGGPKNRGFSLEESQEIIRRLSKAGVTDEQLKMMDELFGKARTVEINGVKLSVIDNNGVEEFLVWRIADEGDLDSIFSKLNQQARQDKINYAATMAPQARKGTNDYETFLAETAFRHAEKGKIQKRHFGSPWVSTGGHLAPIVRTTDPSLLRDTVTKSDTIHLLQIPSSRLNFKHITAVSETEVLALVIDQPLEPHLIIVLPNIFRDKALTTKLRGK